MPLEASPWWDPRKAGKASNSPPHVRLIPLVQSLRRLQAQRYTNMRRMRAVYEYGFAAAASTSNDLAVIDDRKLHFNPAKNAIDTMHAQVCTPRIGPMVMTEGGTFSQRERAEMATKAVDGVLADNAFDEVQEDAVRDGLIEYLGFAHVFSRIHGPEGDQWGEIVVERVNPQDIIVDDAEARDGKPRCIYRRRRMDRFVALAMYGGADPDLFGSKRSREEAIRKAPSARDDDEGSSAQETDVIEVWEAWHLPSGLDVDDAEASHDGLYVIAIEGCTLYVEPWARESFPFFEYRPEKAGKGFWGLSVMRQLMAGQREHEKLTDKLQRAHRALGSSAMVVYGDVGVDFREIGNGQGQLFGVKGPPGSVAPLTPAPANPQSYQYRESVSGDMLRYIGLSEFAAQSEVPRGLEGASGKALQKFEDTESKRGVIRHRARERFVVGVAQLILEEARNLLKRGIRVESRVREKGSFSKIDWRDIVDVLEDKKSYVVSLVPVGVLDKTPAAKYALLDSWLERQVITVEQYKRMADMPDLEAETSVDCADYEIIDKNLDYMMRTGKFVAPQPFDNLQLIIQRGGKYYNAMRVQGEPDSRLELVRRYILEADTLANPPPPAGDPMAPPSLAPMGPANAGLAPADPAAMVAPMGPPAPPVGPPMPGGPPPMMPPPMAA